LPKPLDLDLLQNLLASISFSTTCLPAEPAWLPCCCAVTQRYLPKPVDLELLQNPLVSPVYMRNFEGLVQSSMLVVAGGCEGLTPDITRWAGMLFLGMHVLWCVHAQL
jgi:acetyl esterase/lipase